MRFFSRLAFILGATLALGSGFSSPANADPILFTQGPYLSQDDSPFTGANFSYFFLEDFEDALLNTPAPVPEPSTILMVGAGAAALLRKRLKKGKK